MKNFLFWALAALLILLTIFSAAQAASAHDYYGTSPNYYYYENHASLPVVAGPYPRYYLGFNDYRNSGQAFLHDDFDNYDSFIGYRDLDVYYPDRGYVDVLREPGSSIEPPVLADQVYRSADEYHVQGYLPNGGIYVKHYYHDHDWDLNEAQDYSYFQPIELSTRPIATHPCQSQSICQKTHCNCVQ
jgi:hypothetical protein